MPDNDVNSYTASDFDLSNIPIQDQSQSAKHSQNNDYAEFAEGDDVGVFFIHHTTDGKSILKTAKGRFSEFLIPHMYPRVSIGVVEIQSSPFIVYVIFPVFKNREVVDGMIVARDLIGLQKVFELNTFKLDIHNRNQFSVSYYVPKGAEWG